MIIDKTTILIDGSEYTTLSSVSDRVNRELIELLGLSEGELNPEINDFNQMIINIEVTRK